MRDWLKVSPRARNGSTKLSSTATAILQVEREGCQPLVKARKPVHEAIPTNRQVCERLPPNTLIDGEVVALDASGRRVSFNLLQHHRSKAQALVFYAFGVLIYRARVDEECVVLASIFWTCSALEG
jgi:hypothetical protein